MMVLPGVSRRLQPSTLDSPTWYIHLRRSLSLISSARTDHCRIFGWNLLSVTVDRKCLVDRAHEMERRPHQRVQIHWNGQQRQVTFLSLLFYPPSTLHDSTTFTCTSNGILRRTSLISDEGNDSKIFQIHEQSHLDLPSRLYDWRLSDDGQNFAYGGDEVDLSLWNTDRAFQTAASADPSVSQSSLKRRKKNHDLYPGEIWRARNVSFPTCPIFRCAYAMIVAK
jgi:hypothetical protein